MGGGHNTHIIQIMNDHDLVNLRIETMVTWGSLILRTSPSFKQHKTPVSHEIAGFKAWFWPWRALATPYGFQGLVCQANREHSTKGYFKIKTNNCSLGGKMIWAHSTHLASTKKIKKWFPAKTSGLEWTLILILNEIYFLYRHLLHLSKLPQLSSSHEQVAGFHGVRFRSVFWVQ